MDGAAIFKWQLNIEEKQNTATNQATLTKHAYF